VVHLQNPSATSHNKWPKNLTLNTVKLKRIIRQNSNLGAAEIQDAILAGLRQFQQGVETADDITLVIIKVKPES
jgi:serine phosphatase RsbU (regulator of sigma subunit)